MSNINFFEQYINSFSEIIEDIKSHFSEMEELFKILQENGKNDSKVVICGNGGSSAIAAHVSVDLMKNANVRAINLNEVDLITCYANDYGFSNWVKEALIKLVDKKDTVILISSSGNSENMVRAAKWCIEEKIKLVTLTGMLKDNKLKKLNSKSLNIWIDSMAYNFIENAHQIILLSIVDALIGSYEYKATPEGYLKE